jgi:hypothetical protein
MDEDPTGKEEAPLFKLSCKQDWRGAIHTNAQAYICDIDDIQNGPVFFFKYLQYKASSKFVRSFQLKLAWMDNTEPSLHAQ